MESKKGNGAAGRRSGGGGNPQLRSPAVKRPASAPVALQGWLHKQGSEGLMLWRRRWFVLAEYCLFYYKGPQEDKLLGSILLPSYKVSPCSADDKVYRKFSFKAEHANMRTYYFAADSRELMVQWMNALSLASILQDTGSWEEQRLGRPSVSSVSSQMNASADDSDSGFHGYRPSSNSPAPVPPPPLYANAPPKPRRVSPETISQQPQPQHHLEAPPVVYEPRLARPQEPYRPPPPPLHVNNERRTPDAYSRSNPKGADYEDVYTSTGDNAAVPAQFRSGGGSVAYIKGAGLPQQAAYLRDLVPPPAMYRTPQRPPPRPHSADFLDYDVRRSVPPPQQQPLYQPHSLPHPPRERDRDHSRQHGARLARPKSSLDVAPAADYWSEEAYATKMRRQLAAQQRFLRSASARLPPRAAGTTNSGAAPTLEGERRSQQQREESMKRLLEWKQRMLQSPLTRKPAGSNNTIPTTRGGVLPGAHSDIYKQQVLRELEARRRATDGRRPSAPAAPISRYNSFSSDDEASGSGSVMGREPPRAVSAMSLQVSTTQPEPAKTPDQLADTSPAELGVSAGELLGRTHEELVLLLIQLRRTSAAVCKAMETCHMDIEEQARLAELDTPKRMEHLKKLEDLKKHLLDLEKQYEKGKPLVNLVDNMVKLGSLYRGPSARERVQFNQKVQEQRLLAEERRDWDRLSPDRTQLQAKVQQLYRLDRLLQEESSTLQSLQQDKELLERALGGLRHKLQSSNHFTPIEIEHYRKQQRSLERELSRVRLLLAHNSKKLEETVAENARLEQELVVLRQKLQRPITEPGIGTAALEAELRRVQRLVGDLTRQRKQLSLQVQQLTQQRPGPTGVAGAGPIPGRKRHHSTWLETDLDSLVTIDQAIDSPASPTYQTTSSGSTVHTPLYVNTETNSSRKDSGIYDAEDEAPPPLPAPPEIPPDYPPPPPPPPPPSEDVLLSPGQQYCAQVDISEADDRMKRFYGIIPREKQQEIKTVRIVKRESERRQRDRDRSGNIGIPLTNGIVSSGKRVTISESSDNIETSPEKTPLGRVEEEVPECVRPLSDPNLKQDDDDDPAVDAQFQRSMSLPRGFGKREKLVVAPPPPPVRSTSPRGDSATNLRNLVISSRSHHERFDGSGDSSSSSPQLSPVFKSQAARAIVEEVSAQPSHKRPVPKEKRRHHTVSSSKPLLDLEANLTPMGCTRSRDDLDMERALRPRINTPDVVRSTMSHKDFKYNEDTIDSILGTPSKIIIPERYIPEQAPVLSAEEQLHRLKKAEAIRKMLSETTGIGTSDGNEEEEQTATLKKKVAAEKKQREHLLQLNQLLARQVMEKSKVVAGSTSAAAQE